MRDSIEQCGVFTRSLDGLGKVTMMVRFAGDHYIADGLSHDYIAVGKSARHATENFWRGLELTIRECMRRGVSLHHLFF